MLPSILVRICLMISSPDPFRYDGTSGVDPLYGKHSKNLMKTDVRGDGGLL